MRRWRGACGSGSSSNSCARSPEGNACACACPDANGGASGYAGGYHGSPAHSRGNGHAHGDRCDSPHGDPGANISLPAYPGADSDRASYGGCAT